jgi:hypothetical protein
LFKICFAELERVAKRIVKPFLDQIPKLRHVAACGSLVFEPGSADDGFGFGVSFADRRRLARRRAYAAYLQIACAGTKSVSVWEPGKKPGSFHRIDVK